MCQRSKFSKWSSKLWNEVRKVPSCTEVTYNDLFLRLVKITISILQDILIVNSIWSKSIRFFSRNGGSNKVLTWIHYKNCIWIPLQLLYKKRNHQKVTNTIKVLQVRQVMPNCIWYGITCVTCNAVTAIVFQKWVLGLFYGSKSSLSSRYFYSIWFIILPSGLITSTTW